MSINPLESFPPEWRGPKCPRCGSSIQDSITLYSPGAGFTHIVKCIGCGTHEVPLPHPLATNRISDKKWGFHPPAVIAEKLPRKRYRKFICALEDCGKENKGIFDPKQRFCHECRKIARYRMSAEWQRKKGKNYLLDKEGG